MKKNKDVIYVKAPRTVEYLEIVLEHTQKQLAEANKVIKEYGNMANWFTYYDDDDNAWYNALWWNSDGYELAKDYLEMWGVK